MATVAVAGVVNVRLAHAVDAFPVPWISGQRRPGGLSVRPSGSGWTVATTLQALGTAVYLATYVGSDPLGLVAAQGLRARGWSGPGVLSCESQPRALVLYDQNGRRSGTTDLRSTPQLRYPAERFAALLDSQHCELAVLTNIGFTLPLIAVAAQRGLAIATDLHQIEDIEHRHNQPWMRAAHVLACSHERLPHGPRDWVEAMWRRYGTPMVLVGCGRAGAVIGIRACRGIWRVASSTPRGVRYTGGAGDTLLGAFVHHLLACGDPVVAARYAVLAAGWKVGGHPDEEFDLSHIQVAELAAVHGLPTLTRLR
jgi:sugar/nucleoside kinase (ribokinase family)